METLKISDLSVGDWVLMNGEPAKALRLTMAGRATFKGLSGQIYGSVGGDISPLPIVPEILEANGFVKNGGVYKWSNEKHHIFVWLNGFSHFVDVEEMDKQFVTKSSRIEVSQFYVHQLQHALRLAGVEKEIVMPNK